MLSPHRSAWRALIVSGVLVCLTFAWACESGSSSDAPPAASLDGSTSTGPVTPGSDASPAPAPDGSLGPGPDAAADADAAPAKSAVGGPCTTNEDCASGTC